MQTFSRHLLAEFRDCDALRINDPEYVARCMRAAAEAAGTQVVGERVHKFGDCGVSGVLLLAESHLSVHSWPEASYAAADIYTCGDDCDPWQAFAYLRDAFGASRFEVMEVERGRAVAEADTGMRVRVHESGACTPSARAKRA